VLAGYRSDRGNDDRGRPNIQGRAGQSSKGISRRPANDDMADELTEAADAFRGTERAPPHEQDPVGNMIASHRP
jgi:hypothetical protein